MTNTYPRWRKHYPSGREQGSYDGETWVDLNYYSYPKETGMYLQEALAKKLPLKWPTWPGWYTWDAGLGSFEPVEKHNPRILTLQTHAAAGNKWEVQENAHIEWYQPKLWHRKGAYYKDSRNWYPSIEEMIEAYESDYDIVSYSTWAAPRRFVAK